MSATMPTTGLASESGHWYAQDGSPAYEITGANGKLRAVTLRDARKLNLYPGVSTILGVAAKPALEQWKVRQAVLAALTLPRAPGELDEAYVERVISDSKQQARDAADRGTAIHAALESSLQGRPFEPEYTPHVNAVQAWLGETFGTAEWSVERSFACDAGYGGKVDLYARTPRPVVIDFKTKEFTRANMDRKAVAWPEHGLQLAAYARGLGIDLNGPVQRWNVFVSTVEPGLIAPWMHDESSYPQHLDMFLALLRYWRASKQYAPGGAV